MEIKTKQKINKKALIEKKKKQIEESKNVILK
jgi:hypothetical protein